MTRCVYRLSWDGLGFNRRLVSRVLAYRPRPEKQGERCAPEMRQHVRKPHMHGSIIGPRTGAAAMGAAAVAAAVEPNYEGAQGGVVLGEEFSL